MHSALLRRQMIPGDITLIITFSFKFAYQPIAFLVYPLRAASTENKITAHTLSYNYREPYLGLCIDIRSTDEDLCLIAVYFQAFGLHTICLCQCKGVCMRWATIKCNVFWEHSFYISKFYLVENLCCGIQMKFKE